jgi:hypothetical protein
MKSAIAGGKASPEQASLIIVYTLSKALSISPLDVYQMPATLVTDLLSVHRAFKEIEAEEIDKSMKKIKR